MSLPLAIHRAVDEAEASRYTEMWRSLLPLGLNPDTGGYRRFAWNTADLACREWFRSEAAARGLEMETDRNGNLWAWWGPKGPGAVVTGSHLDSVPDGGAFDGPLGVVSSFAAIDVLRARGFTPSTPFAVACFSDEEGARFGIACAGSRLMTGALDAEKARGMQAYMKSAMPYYGVNLPQVRAISKRVFIEYPLTSATGGRALSCSCGVRRSSARSAMPPSNCWT